MADNSKYFSHRNILTGATALGLSAIAKVISFLEITLDGSVLIKPRPH